MVKREVRKDTPIPNVHKITPFLWKYCCRCKQEFRGSYGWRFEVGEYLGADRGSWSENRYICSDCAKTEEEAEMIYSRYHR